MAVRRRKEDRSAERSSEGGAPRAEASKQGCCGCCCFLKFVFWLSFVSATAGGFFWMYQENEKLGITLNIALEERLASFQTAQKSKMQKEIASNVKTGTANLVASAQLDKFGSQLKQAIEDSTGAALRAGLEQSKAELMELSTRVQESEKLMQSSDGKVAAQLAALEQGSSGLEQRVQDAVLGHVQQAVASGTEQLARRDELQQLQQSSQAQGEMLAAVQLKVEASAAPDLTVMKQELFTDLENYFKLRFVSTESASQLKQDLGTELLALVDQTYAKTQDSTVGLQQSEQRLAVLVQEQLAALKAELQQPQEVPQQAQQAPPSDTQ